MIDEELFIAHVKHNNSGWDKPQKLEDHLYGVSALASSFAKDDDMKAWLEDIGWFHDLGKYSSQFQIHIRKNSGYEENIEKFLVLTNGVVKNKVAHSTAGAIQAIKNFPKNFVGILEAYIIAGHHSGLPDWYPGSP